MESELSKIDIENLKKERKGWENELRRTQWEIKKLQDWERYINKRIEVINEMLKLVEMGEKIKR